MAMYTIFAALACCLLAVSFAVAETESNNLTTTPTITTPGLNLTHTTTLVTSSNSTVHATVISNLTENTTRDNETPAATAESTSQLQTSQSTTVMAPLTNDTSLTTSTPTTHTPTFTALTTATVGNISTPDTTVITTVNSTHTVNTTTDSVHRSTQGLGLDNSEKNMTIVFSVVLGVFALALVVFMFHRCKHKIQYFHQPLNNTDDTDAFVADDDTLVISGGLYDGHPIYDSVPTASQDQSQLRLQFLH